MILCSAVKQKDADTTEDIPCDQEAKFELQIKEGEEVTLSVVVCEHHMDMYENHRSFIVKDKSGDAWMIRMP